MGEQDSSYSRRIPTVQVAQHFLLCEAEVRVVVMPHDRPHMTKSSHQVDITYNIQCYRYWWRTKVHNKQLSYVVQIEIQNYTFLYELECN